MQNNQNGHPPFQIVIAPLLATCIKRTFYVCSFSSLHPPRWTAASTIRCILSLGFVPHDGSGFIKHVKVNRPGLSGQFLWRNALEQHYSSFFQKMTLLCILTAHFEIISTVFRHQNEALKQMFSARKHW